MASARVGEERRERVASASKSPRFSPKVEASGNSVWREIIERTGVTESQFRQIRQLYNAARRGERG